MIQQIAHHCILLQRHIEQLILIGLKIVSLNIAYYCGVVRISGCRLHNWFKAACGCCGAELVPYIGVRNQLIGTL